MIYAATQVIMLLFSAAILIKFHHSASKNQYRYRFFVSLLATIWTGASLFYSASVLLAWPEAVSEATALDAMLSGISAGLAYWCGGNVAELIRKIDKVIP